MALQNIKQILSFALLLFTSCSPIYYSPNTQNVPLITHQGEGNISFGAGNNFDPFRSVGMYELQGAYGLTDHVSLQVNSAFYKGKNIEKNGEGISGKGRLIETGLGYNCLLNRHFIFESYGIFSLGNFENLVVTEGNGQTLKQ